MTKEALLARLLRLPTKDMVPLREPEDHEIIEGDEGPIHYKMTKEAILIPGLMPGTSGEAVVFSLSVSGPEVQRLQFVRDLAETLGTPLNTGEFPEIPGVLYVALWDARDVERRLTSGN